MKKVLNILVVLCISVFIFSCDKIEPPFTTDQNQIDTTTQVKQMVFVEYFTGHRCVTCPTESRRLKNLQEQYSDRLIYVSIHAGFFATPIPGNYSTDYRTTTGNDLDALFGVTAISTPNALINRKEFEGTKVISPGSWASIIASEILIAPTIKIDVEADINGQTINVNTATTTLQNLEGKHDISVFIVEDSLMSYQKNNNSEIGSVPDIADYYHRYVLRESITGSLGVTLFDVSSQTNEIHDKQFNVSLNSTWDKLKLYAICFITNSSTGEVIQAAKVKINP